MTKAMALIDAQQYANQIRRQVYILRRGSQYKATANYPQRGWKLVTTVTPAAVILDSKLDALKGTL